MAADRILVVPPRYFEVACAINPWMSADASVEPDAAQRQWDGLVEAIERAGAEPVVGDPQPGLPDMVFAANCGVAVGDRFLCAQFRHPERQPEASHFAAWFAEHGFTVEQPTATFEGQGDLIFDLERPIAWFGSGFRSDPAMADPIAAFTGREVIALDLVDPRFYHLDTCFCSLPGGAVLYVPEAFTRDSRAAIQAIVPKDQLLAVSPEDAARFVCNAVSIGDRVLLGSASEDLDAWLRRQNLEPVHLDVSEFMKAGGSVFCLCMRFF